MFFKNFIIGSFKILGSLDSEQSNITNQKENKYQLNRCLFGGMTLCSLSCFHKVNANILKIYV